MPLAIPPVQWKGYLSTYLHTYIPRYLSTHLEVDPLTQSYLKVNLQTPFRPFPPPQSLSGLDNAARVDGDASWGRDVRNLKRRFLLFSVMIYGQ
jgi:hypothetical protein